MADQLKTRSIAALLAMAGVIIVNSLAVLLPINQMSTGAISDLYPNYFVPAGFTFSIWSAIYLLLFSFCGYAIWFAFSNQANTKIRQLLPGLLNLFLLTCIINCSWIFLWHYLQIRLSLVVMLLFLITLILIYQKLTLYKSSLSGTAYFFLQVPFSVYLGWISVATIANTTAVLVSSGWEGGFLSPINWAVVMMLVAVALGLLFLFRWKDKAYPLVICWALYGIYFKQGDIFIMARTAAIGIGILLLTILLQYFRQSKKNPGL
ncbi:hypothetical protein [Flavihumibacter sp. UBA7668]|uniref:hypothetical protein n=1 Tax=Flavihumibacter sp. UBA7668 TaxID=1946542 RepID=UPI0025BB418E|nr:hypothetical protein [Flavihumibacter sp. UBA7668]